MISNKTEYKDNINTHTKKTIYDKYHQRQQQYDSETHKSPNDVKLREIRASVVFFKPLESL